MKPLGRLTLMGRQRRTALAFEVGARAMPLPEHRTAGVLRCWQYGLTDRGGTRTGVHGQFPAIAVLRCGSARMQRDSGYGSGSPVVGPPAKACRLRVRAAPSWRADWE